MIDHRDFEHGVRAAGCGVCGHWWLDVDKPQCDCPREPSHAATITAVDKERGIITYEGRKPLP